MRQLPAILIGAAIVLIPNISEAEECARLESDLDRLACYDRQSGRTPVSSSSKSGSWSVKTDQSAFTDEKTVVVAVQSNEEVNCGWNRGAKIAFLARCMENKTSLYFATQCHMTSSDYNDYGDVDYRLDDTPARRLSMSESTDNKALGLWDGSRSVPFLKEMMDKNTMVVRMTPFNENPFTATFDVTGLSEAIKPLREACAW